QGIDFFAVIEVRAAATDVEAGMVLEKLLLLVGAVLGGGVARLFGQLALFFGQFGNFRIENRGHDLVHLGLPLIVELFQLGVGRGGLLAGIIAPQRYQSLGGLAPVFHVVSRLEDGAKAIVIGL